MIDQTLVILKPELLRKGLEYRALEKIQNKGLEVTAMYKDCPPREVFREHYRDVIAKKGETIGNRILNYMTSGPIIVALIKGNNAIREIKKLSGEKTSPQDCIPGTIRFDFSNDSLDLANLEKRAVENSIHCSDSEISANFEIDLWFSKYYPLKKGKHKEKDQYEETVDYEEIADSIGLDLSDWIRDIVHVSNERKFLYHGRKKVKNPEAIISEGLKPVTPEGGGLCRFFSTGLELFYPSVDSPFFNYSGNWKNSNEVELNLAITNHDLLSSLGLNIPPYKNDSQLAIKETIPFNAISMLNIRLIHPESIINPKIPVNKDKSIKTERGYRQIAEQMLLMGIINQLYNEFTPGRIVKYFRDIKQDYGVKND